MIAIALTALAMFGLGLRVWLEVAAFGHRGVKLSELPRWLEQADLREGRVGDLVSDFAIRAIPWTPLRAASPACRPVKFVPWSAS